MDSYLNQRERTLTRVAAVLLLLAAGCATEPTLGEPPPEHIINPTQAGFRIDGPEQVSMHFTEQGLTMTAPKGAWAWGWQLTAVGRPTTMVQAVAATPVLSLRAEGTRLEYDRDNVVEWYVDSPSVILQAFEVKTRPPGAGRLVIQGDVSTTMSADVLEADAGVAFSAGYEAGFVYGDAVAVDANEQPIYVEVRLMGSTLQLQLEDSDATYPIRVGVEMASNRQATPPG